MLLVGKLKRVEGGIKNDFLKQFTERGGNSDGAVLYRSRVNRRVLRHKCDPNITPIIRNFTLSK